MNLRHTNLPIVLTSFVGRHREIDDISQLLASARLVSLVGPGGCGKTRLALRVATQIAGQQSHDIRWVDLARLTDSTLLRQTVAKALNVVEQSGTGLLDTLIESLCGRPTFLVLDNCEHLLAVCAELVEALAGCPDLTILATSREPLGVAGERLYPVWPLALPASNLSVDNLWQVESMQLFIERARSLRPDFRLTPDNAEIVAKICRDLDGIPLAIELASARVSVLTVGQIHARLDRRLDLLVSTTRADGRHRTLRAAIDWSYDQLASAERLLLQRLALFTAGFTLNTAEAACAWGDIRCDAVLDILSSLVSKSLVVADTLQGREARYRLLETIRQYALEKLQASGDWIAAHDTYLACFLRLTEEVAPKLREEYQQLWLNWLEAENDNIRAALAWALEHQHFEAGLRIASSLFSFWQPRGYAREGYTWFERLLNQPGAAISIPVRVNALTWASVMASILGDATTAARWGQEAMALCEAAGQAGKPLLAVALIGAATGARTVGDYQTTYALGERINDLYRELGDLSALGTGIMIQGGIAIALDKYDAAHGLLEESLTLAREAGDTFRIALTLNSLGDLARCERHADQALTFYQESLSLLREIDAAQAIPGTLHNLAYVDLDQGDVEHAQALFRESLEAQRRLEHKEGVLTGLLGFAALAAASGSAAESVRLYATVAANSLANAAILWAPEKIEYERYFGQARARLSRADFEAEQARGRALSLEQAIEYALQLPLSIMAEPAHTQPVAAQGLTEREREAAILISRGLSNGEIADQLVLSKRTVEKHIANILSKLGFTQRAQIVRWALENGLTSAVR